MSITVRHCQHRIRCVNRGSAVSTTAPRSQHQTCCATNGSAVPTTAPWGQQQTAVPTTLARQQRSRVVNIRPAVLQTAPRCQQRLHGVKNRPLCQQRWLVNNGPALSTGAPQYSQCSKIQLCIIYVNPQISRCFPHFFTSTYDNHETVIKSEGLKCFRL